MHKFFVHIVIIALLLGGLAGCLFSTATNQTPWYQDIKNWTSHQKADFFMKAWRAENADYKAMKAMPNKTGSMIKVLKAKYEILENSRIPIRMYATAVNTGGQPSQTDEDQIIMWIRQLQRQYLQ